MLNADLLSVGTLRLGTFSVSASGYRTSGCFGTEGSYPGQTFSRFPGYFCALFPSLGTAQKVNMAEKLVF